MQYKKVKILGYIKRNCKCCGETKNIILLEITRKDGTTENTQYCSDCTYSLLGIDLRKCKNTTF